MKVAAWYITTQYISGGIVRQRTSFKHELAVQTITEETLRLLAQGEQVMAYGLTPHGDVIYAVNDGCDDAHLMWLEADITEEYSHPYLIGVMN